MSDAGGEPRMRVAAVVLAAGRGARFGGGKLLASYGGRPLLRAALEPILEADLDDIVVVLGHDAEAVRAALEGLPVRYAENPRFTEGIGTSVAAGVGALPAGTGAALIALGDQPLPGPDVPRRVVEAYRERGGPIVAPCYDGVRGNPVLFDASLFPELLALEGDAGARVLLDRSPDLIVPVHFPFPPPPDVDAPADLDHFGN